MLLTEATGVLPSGESFLRHYSSQWWRQGRQGSYSPLSEHASPPSEGEKLFSRRLGIHHPENCTLAPSSEVSASRPKNPGATPASSCSGALELWHHIDLIL